jgi:hypothetical protein
VQVAWYLQCRAITLKAWIDDTELEEEVGCTSLCTSTTGSCPCTAAAAHQQACQRRLLPNHWESACCFGCCRQLGTP